MSLPELLAALDSAGFDLARGLLAFVWQSSIFLTAVVVIALFLRRKRAAIRHRLWTGALLLLPLLPLIGGIYSVMSAPRAELQVFPVYTPPVAALPSTAENSAVTPRAVPEAAPFPESNGDIPALPVTGYPWAFLLIGYVTGAILSLVLLGLGWMRLRRWRRTGNVVTDPRALALFGKAEQSLGLSRSFRLVECPGLSTPLTLGFFHPVVLLPAGMAASLTDDRFRALAAHELAHMRRGDPLTLAAVSLLRAVLFFHPLVWYAASRVADLAERACDDRVLESGCEPVEYADLLADLAATLRKPAFTTELAAGFVFTRHAFLHRVEAILSPRRALGPLSRRALAGVLVLTAVSLAVAFALPLTGKGKQSPATWEAFLQAPSLMGLREHLRAIGEDPGIVTGTGSVTGIYRAVRKSRPPLTVVECAPYNEYPRPYWGVLVIFRPDGSILRTMDHEVIEKGVVEPDSAGIMEKLDNDAVLDLPDLDGDGNAEIPVCRKWEKQREEGTCILYSTRSENLPAIFALDMPRRWPYIRIFVERKGAARELRLMAEKKEIGLGNGFKMPVGSNLQGDTVAIESEDRRNENPPAREIAVFRWSAGEKRFTGPKYGPVAVWEILDPLKTPVPQERRFRSGERVMPPTMELVIRRPRAVFPETGVSREDSLALAEFKQRYSLKAGEDLKYIGPPFLPARNVFYRLANPVETNYVAEKLHCILFEYDDELHHIAFCQPNVDFLLQVFLSPKPYEMIGDRAILEKKVEGDFIIRKGLSRERAALLLEQIFTRDLKIPVSLTFREEPREVIVAKGSWRFTPPPEGPPLVQVYPGKPESLREGMVREDSLGAFLSWIGEAAGRPVVDEVASSHSIPVVWHSNGNWNRDNQLPEAVFQQVSRQSGLNFTIEKRPVVLLRVERKQ